jgi:hypothetical protein
VAPWKWGSQNPESRYPSVEVPKDDEDDDISDTRVGRDNEDRDAMYVTPDTLDVLKSRAKRKEQVKKAAKTGGKLLRAGGSLLAKGAVEGSVMLAKGAKEASVQIGRYQKWVEQTNADLLVRQEKEQQLAIERQKREVERRKTAMDLQREQRQLDLEERRLNIEMMREEAKFRRETGDQSPRGGSPPQQQVPPFGFGTPQRQMEYGFGAPRQQGPSFDFGTPQRPRRMEYGFGTPAPEFRSPTDIVNYDGGISLFGLGGQRPAPRNPGRKNGTPKKRSSR